MMKQKRIGQRKLQTHFFRSFEIPLYTLLTKQNQKINKILETTFFKSHLSFMISQQYF